MGTFLLGRFKKFTLGYIDKKIINDIIMISTRYMSDLATKKSTK